MKLRDLEPRVLRVLVDIPETRKDDFLLIKYVLDDVVSTEISFGSIMLNHKELGIPSFESITRCRRKLQEKNPELVDIPTLAIREEKFEEYKQYALDIRE